VQSPCIGICKIDPHHSWCQGCLRTLAEITAWSQMSSAQKLNLLMVIQTRQAQGKPANTD
jgi:predicted Fe-S protein YdhL (DUF1289 family)